MLFFPSGVFKSTLIIATISLGINITHNLLVTKHQIASMQEILNICSLFKEVKIRNIQSIILYNNLAPYLNFYNFSFETVLETGLSINRDLFPYKFSNFLPQQLITVCED